MKNITNRINKHIIFAIPKINPATPIPFEASLLIPTIPKIMAMIPSIAVNKFPTINPDGEYILTILRIIRANDQLNPIIPTTKAVIPFALVGEV